MLHVNGLTYEWPGATRLGPLAFSAGADEIVGVFGRSGTGKTTLFRILAGELLPHDGSVTYDGVGQRVYHDQLQKVVPWYSAKSNALLALNERQRNSHGSQIEHILRMSGIEEFAERDGTRLSGGQRARVALARTLLENAELLLLDEPFTGVDALSQEVIVENLPDILANKLTFVTAHDPGVIVQLSSRILCLKQGVERVSGFFHEFRSPEFVGMNPRERRNSDLYIAEVHALLESLYE